MPRASDAVKLQASISHKPVNFRGLVVLESRLMLEAWWGVPSTELVSRAYCVTLCFWCGASDWWAATVVRHAFSK